jgi:hypothetical protein
VTLGRLVLAWVPVALWLAGARWLSERPRGAALRGRRVAWAAAEAGALTLFASLWFDSLGSSGWVLVFVLVGLAAGFSTRLGDLDSGAPARHALLLVLMDAARYVAAGGILAWRLA